MSKLRAFFIHLLISMFVVGAFLAMAFFIWYPGIYFDVDGAHNIIAILGGVDVILGPLLTLVVFKSGKPSLKLDLSVIALIQIAAFIYGANIIYSERPAYVVQLFDRFQTVPAAKVNTANITLPELKTGPFTRPLLVGIKLPDDTEQVRAILEDSEQSGIPIVHRTELYVPFSEEAENALTMTQPISVLLENAPNPEKLRKHLSGVTSDDIETLRYFRLLGKNKIVTMVIEPETGLALGIVDQN